MNRPTPGDTARAMRPPDCAGRTSRAVRDAPSSAPPTRRGSDAPPPSGSCAPPRLTGRPRNARSGELFVALDPTATEPLYEQLYRGIREAIVAGQLRPTARIPSTRSLARDLSVSRSTVLLAIAQLEAEGFLTSHARSGTRVSATPPDTMRVARSEPTDAPDEAPGDRHISDGGQRATSYSDGELRLGAAPRAFRIGTPALDAFPTALWARLATRRYRRLTFTLLDHADPIGYAPLRHAIADHVHAARGIRCSAAQILVTSGAQQALSIAAQILLNPGDAVWLEDPGYQSMRGVFELLGAHVIPVGVDDEGLDVDDGVRRGSTARLAYVTPTSQFPFGVTMSAARRRQLVDWAASSGAWIIEDDYDSESRFSGMPLPPLHAVDGAHRVIYVGTFSKTVFPSLGIGYLIAPPDLIPVLTKALLLSGRHPSPIDQAILADFITEGHFARHVRRLRALYADRRRRFVEVAGQELSGLVSIRPTEAGLHVLAWLPAGMSDRAVSDALARRGIEAPALSTYYCANSARACARGALLLGYGALDEVALRDGVRVIRDVLAVMTAGAHRTTSPGVTARRTAWPVHGSNEITQ